MLWRHCVRPHGKEPVRTVLMYLPDPSGSPIPGEPAFPCANESAVNPLRDTGFSLLITRRDRTQPIFALLHAAPVVVGTSGAHGTLQILQIRALPDASVLSRYRPGQKNRSQCHEELPTHGHPELLTDGDAMSLTVVGRFGPDAVPRSRAQPALREQRSAVPELIYTRVVPCDPSR